MREDRVEIGTIYYHRDTPTIKRYVVGYPTFLNGDTHQYYILENYMQSKQCTSDYVRVGHAELLSLNGWNTWFDNPTDATKALIEHKEFEIVELKEILKTGKV